MFKKECVVCGAAFETKYRTKIICSFNCKQQSMRDRAKDYDRMKRAKAKDSININ